MLRAGTVAATSRTSTRRFARRERVLWLIGPPALITAFFLVTTLNSISVPQLAAAYGLLLIPWWSYAAWKRQREVALPFLACVAFMFWVFYAVPLFWGDRIRPGLSNTGFVTDDSITASMWLALLGVASLWLGTKVRIGKRLQTGTVRDVFAQERRWTYLRFVLVAATLPKLVTGFSSLGGAEISQLLDVFTTFLPLVIFIILFRNLLRGSATRFDKYAIVAFLGVNFLIGLSTGWLGAWLTVALAAILTFLLERRRLRLIPIILAVVYVLFFQAGKHAYRDTAWYGGAKTGTPVDAVANWFGLSWSVWQQSLSTGDVGPQLFQSTVMRTSLLTQTANVAELTPQVVPYQYGATYPYVVEGLVPRLIWPSKPSQNEANQFYQVAYGLTPANNLASVSIAVGFLTEAYINFGWLGVIAIMFLVGVLFNLTEKLLLSHDAGLLFTALGIAVLLQFMTIESQMGVYLGGLIQKVLFSLLVLWPVTYSTARRAVEQPSAWRRRAVSLGSSVDRAARTRV
jgi:hypothetical protein